jgi:very-short-patch-repair endonuclease
MHALPPWRELARRQHGVFACWQLVRIGMSRDAIEHRTRRLRALYDGVYVTGEAPVTRWQRWWGATLTAPGSALALESAAAAWEIRRWDAGVEVVMRPGNGGPRRHGDLVAYRSRRVGVDRCLLDVTTLDGLAITTPERTIADLWRRLPSERERRKMLREALRLRRTSIPRMSDHLVASPSSGRPTGLVALLAVYQRLDLHRCRSDAEAHAVELIDEATLPRPEVNVNIAGEEADLSWPDRRLIVEIDGDQFHRDKAEDARRTAIWTAAGWTVRRALADLVFTDAAAFITALRRHLHH